MKKLLLLILFLFACGAALADQGMTSPVHEANVGKIVFSDRVIPFGKEDPSQLKTTFKLGEPIYGRYYFPQSMVNTPLFHEQTGEPIDHHSHRDGTWELQVYVDGVKEELDFQTFAMGEVSDKAAQEWTTWQVNLAPDNPKLREKFIADPWLQTAAALSPGTHEIKLVFEATQGQFRSKPMAVGSFNLVVEEGASFSGGEFPAGTYTGSDVESLKQSMRKALVGPVTKNAGEILDVSVTSDWQHARYTDTLEEYRRIQGTVLWSDKDGDGVNRYTSYFFVQDKQGSGWSDLRFQSFSNGGPEGNVKL